MKETPMKRCIAAAILGVLAVLGFGTVAASADPSITLCHSVHVVVNGSDVVNDAACNTAP
jgi:hypothetical protein